MLSVTTKVPGEEGDVEAEVTVAAVAVVANVSDDVSKRSERGQLQVDD